MVEELKLELEKTFNRKIISRGDCESLAQDIYEKTGETLSYNTLRRLYGLAEFRKPRESTLNQLAIYCGFRSFKDFTQRYLELDTWPTWQGLYIALSQNNHDALIEILRFRKLRQIEFTISITIVIRELLLRRDAKGLLRIFREPVFQFDKLPYDEVAQIGVLVGIIFRNYNEEDIEETLLQEPNFINLVFKIFVDYSQLNGKYGHWIKKLQVMENLDIETKQFIHCLDIWRRILAKEKIPADLIARIPKLSMNQHPILFGRIFGIHMICLKSKTKKKSLVTQFMNRLNIQPQFATELLYEPAVQCLVTQDPELNAIVAKKANLTNDIKFWYHYSQVNIHRIFQVLMLMNKQEYVKAQNVLQNFSFGQIRHGYREFIELYVVFFRWKIAAGLKEKDQNKYKQIFINHRKTISHPIFTSSYFTNYFQA
ncbi:MAG: hypothetical protein QNK51_07780 [Chitinophagales bacterium]